LPSAAASAWCSAKLNVELAEIGEAVALAEQRAEPGRVLETARQIVLLTAVVVDRDQ
jgi:hypothetical protein